MLLIRYCRLATSASVAPMALNLADQTFYAGSDQPCTSQFGHPPVDDKLVKVG